MVNYHLYCPLQPPQEVLDFEVVELDLSEVQVEVELEELELELDPDLVEVE